MSFLEKIKLRKIELDNEFQAQQVAEALAKSEAFSKAIEFIDERCREAAGRLASFLTDTITPESVTASLAKAYDPQNFEGSIDSHIELEPDDYMYFWAGIVADDVPGFCEFNNEDQAKIDDYLSTTDVYGEAIELPELKKLEDDLLSFGVTFSLENAPYDDGAVREAGLFSIRYESSKDRSYCEHFSEY